MSAADDLLRQALHHHRAGQLGQAIGLYLQLATARPDLLAARRYLSIALMDIGRSDLARSLLEQLIAQDPASADLANLLGHALAGSDFENGDRWLGRSASLDPAAADYLFDCIRVRLLRGAHDRAYGAARALVRLRSGDPDHWDIAAEAARLAGHPGVAQRWLHAGMQLDPAAPRLSERLGAILLQRDCPDQARLWLSRSLRIDPSGSGALSLLATLMVRLGQADPARRLAQRTLRLTPAEGGAWLALASLATGSPIVAAQRAVRSEPLTADAWNVLGLALHRAGKPGAACLALHTALALVPDMAAAWNNLAAALLAHRDAPRSAAAFGRAGRLVPDKASISSNALFGMNYDTGVTDADLAEAHRAWGERAVRLAPRFTIKDTASPSDGPLTLGFISPDFKRHPVGYFLLPLLEHLDRSRFRVNCYSDVGTPDDLTDAVRHLADGWRQVTGQPDSAIASLILADKVDILVDLAGHTAGNRLTLFAGRVAPLQVSWLGYFHSTGLPTMDALLSDMETVPDQARSQFVERVVHLPAGRLCYAPPAQAPEPCGPPMLSSGYPTFGSFNNVSKLTAEVVSLWAAILKDCPGSRLLLKWHTLADPRERGGLEQAFADQGIRPDRLLLRGPSQHDSMLAEYGDVDVALDPFPFTGCLTTCEALWMGVPVVTLAGTRPVARQGVAFLSKLGRSDLIAASPGDYRAIAKRLVSSPADLALARRHQREAMKTRLCDGQLFTRGFERALLELWGEARSRSGERSRQEIDLRAQ